MNDGETYMSKKIAIVGSGYMGGGIAQAFALAGYSCVISDVSSDIAEHGRERIVLGAEKFEEGGLFPEGGALQIAQNISSANSIEEAVEGAFYVAEVVPEDRKIKAEALRRISDSADSSAIIGSNTSAMSITELSAFVEYPERFLGVHWMNPAPFVPCVEIIPSSHTSSNIVDLAEELIASLGKITSRASDSAGFVANRLQFALFREAALLVEEGVAEPVDIDEIVSNSFGFRLPFFGPFAIADMAGLDVYAGAYDSLERGLGSRFSAPAALTSLVGNGNLGTKTGQGFSSYDPETAQARVDYRNRAYVLLAKLRKDLGPRP
jgi:3-hydroxybutyryl-CoA dehydrogenase